MKKLVLIGGISTLLLLSIIVGIFVVQNPSASARSTYGRHKPSASITIINSTCTRYQQALAQKTRQHLASHYQCYKKVWLRSRGKGKPKSTPTPIPTIGRPAPTPTQVLVTPAPTQVLITPTPTQLHPTPTATPTSSGNGGGTPDELQLTQSLFTLINQDRAAQGLPAYIWSQTLANGAHQHSINMAQPQCGLSHQCPGEPNPCQRVTNEGLHWMACGENAGYTSPYPDKWTAVKQSIEQGMLSEQAPNDGHRKNLLSSTFHHVGVGIYIDSKGIIWVTEDFTD